jgi:hypothetical protein
VTNEEIQDLKRDAVAIRRLLVRSEASKEPARVTKWTVTPSADEGQTRILISTSRGWDLNISLENLFTLLDLGAEQCMRLK